MLYCLLLPATYAGCESTTSTTPASDLNKQEGIIISTPAAVGVDSNTLHTMSNAIATGEYPNIHSVLIAKNGRLIYEKYFPGKDEILGNSIGVVNHHMDTLHDIRSVTKSIVSACIGIAISKGFIKSVDESIWNYFPRYASLNTGNKATLTIRHLLTMTSGLEWNESIPYTDPANSEIQMDKSEDPIAFVLSRKLNSRPGKTWNYNGGTTQLLAAIIRKATGLEVDAFARNHLFEPLGIVNVHWLGFRDSTSSNNVPLAASGLRMRSRDMLKFGLLYMNKGIWNQQRIFPENWVTESHKWQVARDDPFAGKGGYGYQFWTWQQKYDTRSINLAVAVGNGDQRIFCDHENELLVVTTAGNYNNWTIKKNPGALLNDFIYPAIFPGER